MFSPLLLSLSACNEQSMQTAQNLSEVNEIENKQSATETPAQTDQQADTNNEPKSTEQLWQESKQLTKEVWEKSKKSGEQLWDESKQSSNEILQESKQKSDLLWESTLENSNEIWIDTKETSTEVWNDVKDTSEQIWLDGNQAFETLMKTKEQENASDEKTDVAAELPEDET